MKKLAKFLSLAFLTVSCCFSAHAKINGKPVNTVQFDTIKQQINCKILEYVNMARQNFKIAYPWLNIQSDFAYKWALEYISKWHENADDLDKKLLRPVPGQAGVFDVLSFNDTMRQYAWAIDKKRYSGLNCPCWSGYVLQILESQGIQCGTLQINLKDTGTLHDVIIFSLQKSEKGRQWFIIDASNAAGLATAQVFKKAEDISAQAGKKGLPYLPIDYKEYLCMPLQDYLDKYCDITKPQVVVKDTHRTFSLYDTNIFNRENITKESGFVHLHDWLLQANQIPKS